MSLPHTMPPIFVFTTESLHAVVYAPCYSSSPITAWDHLPGGGLAALGLHLQNKSYWRQIKTGISLIGQLSRMHKSC
eukprot:scaffold244775_cov19-Prasinocladus_malaysianus.AAC.3